MAGKQVLSTHNLHLVLMGQGKLYRETKRKSDGFTFYTRMKTTRNYLTQNVTATIFRPRGLFFVCLVLVAFPMSIKGDFAVGLAQGKILMSWTTNVTDISFIRFVVNPNGANIIHFSIENVTGTAVPGYSSKVTDIGNVSLGTVSFRLLSLTVADAGRYYYKGIESADEGQVLVIAGIPANITVMAVADPLENEKYTMQCSAQSTSVPLGMGLTMHYQWKRENGQNITVSDRYSFSSNQSNLTINPLQRQDTGIFVCEAWEHVGAVSQSAPFSLKVIYGPDPGNIQLSPNRTSHEVAESSSLSVNCSTDCFPDCQYSWTGPDGRAKSDTMMLSIISIGRNQTGNYTCTAANSRIPNKTATSTINVVVFYGPDDRNVSLSPSNTSYQLIEMSRLDVKCSATCFPQCYYQWSGPLVSQNDTTGLLSISQISRNQTGTFSCSVTNPKISGKPATANFSVIVYYGPNINGLTLSPSNTSYQMKELSPLIVNCLASCVPQCNYQWMGPGITQNNSRGLLSISQISRNQTGIFACIVNNPMIPGKSVTANFSVTVYYGPDAPLTLYPVTTSYRDIEGTFITDITCSADCNPPCNYQWIGPLGATSSGVLSLGTYDRIKRGSYFCTATNPKTSTSFNGSTIDMVVIYGPDVPYMLPSTTLYTKLEGESVPDINCSADCFPGCTQVWMKGCSAVQESNGKTLSLRQVTREKAGDYTCWFNNTESRATGNISMKLIVKYPPVLTMKATNTSKEGRVVINCMANGVPDNYTFYKLTHMAPDESRTIVRELELTRVLNSDVSFTIENATYQDTGFYVCKASNGITHYSTGQLVIEDMVSVWITDLPVITSDAQDFDAEKGKTGHLYIEFYSGLFQSLVTWYIDKNGTMELLQNSSNFRIYLSAVTVGLKYYQKTVQLPGYYASLEVYDVNDEQFASYKVEINNGFTEPLWRTIELKPRGPPETPTNLGVVPDSVTTHSLQLTWQAGFHGGASQTFVIEYREAGKTNWLNKTESKGLVQYVSLNTSITDLKDGTTYEFRIYSENSFNRSQVSSTVNETTRTVITPDSSSTFSLPAVAGGIGAGVVVILMAVVALFLWRRYHHHSQHTDGTQRNQINAKPARHDAANGQDYEGLHIKNTEASEYLQLNAIVKMATGKAAGPSDIVEEMMKPTSMSGVALIRDLFEAIIRDGHIPTQWEESYILVSLYKGKGDALDRSNYRGLKMMDQIMKVFERVIDQLIRQQAHIGDMQFGFRPGRGTVDAIYILRQMQEKHIAVNKPLYMSFIDLEKAFDRIPRNVVWWAMRKLGVEEWLVKTVQSMYSNARSHVRVGDGYSDEFNVNVGVYQGSVLSPLLFIVVLEALSIHFRTSCPYKLLYADDLVIVDPSLEAVVERVTEWKKGMEEKGLRVSMGKSKVLVSGLNRETLKSSGKYPCAVCLKGAGRNSIFCISCSHWVHKKCSGINGPLKPDPSYKCPRCSRLARLINGRPVTKVTVGEEKLYVVADFCYLGDTISSKGGCEPASTTRCKSAWNKFRELIPILTNRHLTHITRGHLYSTYIRPVLLYGSETWAVTATTVRKIHRNDKAMIRWICHVNPEANVPFESLLIQLNIRTISDIIQSNRMRWLGHVERSKGWISKVRSLKVTGSRAPGRPKLTWEELTKRERRWG